jgi:cell division septal protein FtsQ
MTEPTRPTENDERAKTRASLRRHAAILLAIVFVGIVWLALVTWFGFQSGG